MVFVAVLQSFDVFNQSCSGLSSHISEDSLTAYLRVLTSDSLEGREAGYPGQRKAAHYLALHFERLGFKGLDSSGGFLQTFLIKEEQTPTRSFSIGGKSLRFLQDYYYWPGIPDVAIQAEEIVFTGYGIKDPKSGYDNFQGLDVSGKVIVALQDEPMSKDGKSLVTGSTELSDWSRSSRLKTDFLKSLKPSAVLVVSRFFADDISKWGHYLEKKRVTASNRTLRRDSVPVIFIHENVLADILMKGGQEDLSKLKIRYVQSKAPLPITVPVSLSLTILHKDSLLETENVVAYWEGSDMKEEYVILTAHYDHLGKRPEGIYPGADDDGSGTAALMEIARLLKLASDKGVRPRRSILIMPVSAEEKGLLGSAYYVNYPLLDLKQAVANLNIDMVGRKDAMHHQSADYVYIIGSNFLSRELHEVNEEANRDCVGMNLDYTFNDPDEPNRLYYRSDHYNFARHNIPCIFYFSGLHEDYHQPTDTLEKLDISLLKKRTQLVFETLWKLANREYRPSLDGR